MKLAPIVLFTYNRPWHTRKTIEALQKNLLAPKSELFIFSDGPKNEQHVEFVDEVRRYLITIGGFSNITLIKREKNFGLANSVITGVTDVVNKYGRIIVLEDDLVTSPYFLQFMNSALDLYADNELVGSINGFLYPIKAKLQTFFLRYVDCWGWATWKRSWDLFQDDACILREELRRKGLEEKFDFEKSFPFTDMLEQQIKGTIDSWAIRWQASLFLLNKLSLYPSRSLVQNIGGDGSGVHSGKSLSTNNQMTSVYDIVVSSVPVPVVKVSVVEDVYAYKMICRFFNRLRRKALLPRLKKRVRRILACILKEKK